MIRAILTDIEGTTTSIRFVHDVLFPYAAAQMERFICEHQSTEAVSQELDSVASLAEIERNDTPALVQQLLTWIRDDKKITPLKALQGLIWKDGYERGDFTGHIYDDVPALLEAWKDEGLALYVYSSGSVQAQKLLFSHTEYGDLSRFFDGYFDTKVGAKQESRSYATIAQSIGLPASEVLFLSDIEAELRAADEAGMSTRWLVRDGGVPDAPAFRVAQNFTELRF